MAKPKQSFLENLEFGVKMATVEQMNIQTLKESEDRKHRKLLRLKDKWMWEVGEDEEEDLERGKGNEKEKAIDEESEDEVQFDDLETMGLPLEV
jgi:hypothetical protein